MRKITSIYKAIPIPILKKEAGIKPLQIYIQGQAIKYALKQKDTDGQKAIKDATSKIKIAHQRQKGRPKKPRTTPQGKLLS